MHANENQLNYMTWIEWIVCARAHALVQYGLSGAHSTICWGRGGGISAILLIGVDYIVCTYASVWLMDPSLFSRMSLLCRVSVRSTRNASDTLKASTLPDLLCRTP